MTSSPTYNPYDFANPVTDRELFSGRESELKDIKYYLDQAASAPRPISLALIGNRASGKTSLLNIAAQEADQRNFCTVRIDLDESDVESPLSFFAKFFNAVLFKACSQGGFNGLNGKTYDTYIDMITTYEVPSDKAFCSFRFPIHYAKALAANQTSAAMLDEAVRYDMSVISQELGIPIVVLMDECDVLSLNRPILQKLRNIFMQTTGYMLILAATPELFPALDDVFSPIIRQLKKINVQDFEHNNDSIQCIEGPIRKLDLDPRQVFDLEFYDEIHELSGGRPYEINLICHVLFRRYQERPDRALSLSASALEDIRSELDKSQALSHRRVLQEIRGLSKAELDGLRFLCRANGNMTLKQVITIESIFYGEKRWTYEDLDQVSRDLKAKRIIGSDEQDRLVFLGDEFERIYAKYFAKEHGVKLRIQDLQPRHCWIQYEMGFFRGHEIPISRFWRVGRLLEREDIVNLTTQLVQTEGDDVFPANRWIAGELYWALSQHEDARYSEFVQLQVEFGWLSNHSLFFFDELPSTGAINATKELCQKLEATVKEQGGKLTCSFYQVPIPPRDMLVDAVLRTEERRIIYDLARRHLREACDQYLNKRNKRAASWHADLARRFADDDSFRYDDYNNLGYILLSNGKTELACELFKTSIDATIDTVGLHYVLPRYNLGVVRISQQDLSSAKHLIEEARTGASNLSRGELDVDCLLVPRVINNGISLTEEWKANLLDVVERTLQTIEDCQGANT